MARIRSIKPEFWKTQQEAWGFARERLYLAQEANNDRLTKVGISAHPTRRLSMLQCGNPRRLVLRAVYEGSAEDCKSIERWLLKNFRAQPASTGEWVRASLCEVIQALAPFEGGQE